MWGCCSPSLWKAVFWFGTPPPPRPPVSARYPLYLTDSAEFPLVYLKITQLESSPFCFQCLDLRWDSAIRLIQWEKKPVDAATQLRWIIHTTRCELFTLEKGVCWQGHYTLLALPWLHHSCLLLSLLPLSLKNERAVGLKMRGRELQQGQRNARRQNNK